MKRSTIFALGWVGGIVTVVAMIAGGVELIEIGKRNRERKAFALWAAEEKVWQNMQQSTYLWQERA